MGASHAMEPSFHCLKAGMLVAGLREAERLQAGLLKAIASLLSSVG